MVPVNGRPTISYILDRISIANEVIIIDGELDDIRRFVMPRYPNVQFVRQHEQKGDLHAAYQGLLASKGHGPIVVWFGDTIIDENFMVNNIDGPLVKSVKDPSLWLMTNGRTFVEKPKTSISDDFVACVGVYRFMDRQKFDVACQQAFEQGQYNMIGALTNYVPESQPYWSCHHVARWFDVGNLETYHQTRAEMLKKASREFNELSVDTFYNVLTKRAIKEDHVQKIADEANWYRSLDAKQRLFAPSLVDTQQGELTITFEAGIPLNELLIWDDLPIHTWKTILNKLFDVMHDVFYSYNYIFQEQDEYLHHMWIDKNVKRVQEYAPDLIPWVEKTGKRLVLNAKWSRIIHGDLHTANIIYEPFTGQLKLVDPRGFFGVSTPSGDVQYDICKLWEDLYWGFTAKLAHQEVQRSDVSTHLRNLTKARGYDVDLMRDGGLLLLLTAVPFHSDDPEVQERFIETARRVIVDG